MLFYYLLIGYVLILGGILCSNKSKQKKFNKIYLILTLGIIFGIGALRHSSIGNDTGVYLSFFRKIPYVDLFNNKSGFEWGYVLLNKIIYSISSHQQILLIITSLIFWIGLGKFIYKYSLSPCMSVFLVITNGIMGISFNIIRQSLAMVLLITSYKYIKEKKLYHFICLVLIACLFHKTAIIFIIVYPLACIKFNIKNVAIFLILTIVSYALFNPIINIVYTIFPSFLRYANSEYAQGGIRLASVLNASVIAMMLLSRIFVKTTKLETMEENINIQSIIMLIGFCITILSFKFNLLDRIAYYFNIFSVIYLPNIIVSIKNKDRFLVGFLTIVLFILYFSIIQIYRPEWNNIYPYKLYWM